ncbi:MAG: DsbA family protein [Cognaticolwellia sp.]
MKAKLYYVYDPMCSWCWGYAPTWQRLQKELSDHVDVVYALGGLAPDSDVAMPQEMQVFLQQTWQKISQQLGTEFNFDFWRDCQPRRSTYPACRAALVAREYGKEHAMLAAIQQAYYLQARNPSNNDVLQSLAINIGLNGETFLQQVNSKAVDMKLRDEIAYVRQMPINGFPSLMLVKDNKSSAISVDYHDWRSSFNAILAKI